MNNLPFHIAAGLKKSIFLHLLHGNKEAAEFVVEFYESGVDDIGVSMEDLGIHLELSELEKYKN